MPGLDTSVRTMLLQEPFLPVSQERDTSADTYVDNKQGPIHIILSAMLHSPSNLILQELLSQG